jgi:hypothetical protein
MNVPISPLLQGGAAGRCSRYVGDAVSRGDFTKIVCDWERGNLRVWSTRRHARLGVMPDLVERQRAAHTPTPDGRLCTA